MNKLKLLYAEDEQQIRKDHIVYLQSRYDFTVYEANDGAEALDMYKKYKPDIVLTDITMPKMCGLELTREIRKISNHTKIIILTAHTEQDKLMKAVDLNIINYLVKPINRQKLRSSIDIAIETITNPVDIESYYIIFSHNSKYDMTNHKYLVDDEVVELAKSESILLKLLCEHKNIDISTYDIFVSVWDDFEKEYSSNSVRTLVKKLRKKLPDGVLKNIYGGFYKLQIA